MPLRVTKADKNALGTDESPVGFRRSWWLELYTQKELLESRRIKIDFLQVNPLVPKSRNNVISHSFPKIVIISRTNNNCIQVFFPHRIFLYRVCQKLQHKMCIM
jgi:hypothetical protein